jgi:DNA-3-methyladenine glycosylase
LPPDQTRRLDRSFFSRATPDVAVDLLGCMLWVERNGKCVAGKIVETEAYLDAEDLASHAAWSRRGRETMTREPGRVYMYRAYGIHMMFNIVARLPESVGAVLVRALEPVVGIDLMLERRGVSDPRQIASGPGKLCQAFGLTLEDHLVDLVTDKTIWIEPGPAPDSILQSARIGITRSAGLPLRFFDGHSRCVSAHRRGIVWTGNSGQNRAI